MKKEQKVVCHDCTWDRKIRRGVERHQKWVKTLIDLRLNYEINQNKRIKQWMDAGTHQIRKEEKHE